MKKAFIQKLSIAMASALVITAAAPATADAAASMALNKKSKVLYLNQDNMTNTADSFDFNIKNKGANYKSKYKFKWTVSNSNVKVNQSGVVTAKKVGKTTVKCTVTKKSTGKVYKTLSATVEVKANAETVAINNAPENNQIAVGTTFDFNRTMKAANGGKATDKTEWFLTSDAEGKEALDASIATVNSKGVVTALQAGEFYVFAKTYQSKATKEQGYTAVSEGVKVTAPLEMTDVKMPKINTVELTFNSSVKDVVKNAADVTIQSVATNKSNMTVKSVKVSEDGKTVTVETYQNYAKDTTYSIAAAKTTKEFKAVYGDIASIVVPDQTVAPVEAGKTGPDLKFQVLDANGVDLNVTSLTGSYITVNSGYSNGSSVTSDGKLNMLHKGDKVEVELKYSKWDDAAKKLVEIKSNKATILCAEATATTTSKWTIADKNEAKPFDKTVTEIKAEASDMKLFVKLKDSYNNEVDATGFESLTPNVCLVDNQGNLFPKTAGTATIKVTKGEYVDYITITVKAKAEFTAMTINNGSVSLSNKKLSATELDTEKVKVTLKDNYGDTLNATKTVTVSAYSMTDAKASEFVTVTGSVVTTKGEADIEFKAVEGKTGTATFKISCEGKDQYVTVSVKAPGGVSKKVVVLDKDELDTYVAAKQKVTVSVYDADIDNTKVAKLGANDNLTYKVKNEKGDVKAEGKVTDNFVLDSTNITNKAADATDKVVLAPGTYTLEIWSGPTVYTKEFKVISTKKSSAVEVNNVVANNVSNGSLAETIKGLVTVKVDGQTVTPNNFKLVSYESLDKDVITGGNITWTTTKTSGKVYVEKVSFDYDGDSYEATIDSTYRVFTLNK